MPQDIRPQGYFPQGTFIIPATQVERQRKLAAELRAGMGKGPIQHWTQGAARLAGALGSVLQEDRANQMEQQRSSALAQALQSGMSPDQLTELAARSGDLDLMDVIKYKAAQQAAENSSNQAGLNPQPYKKPDGTWGMFVTDRSGKPIDIPAPGGGSFAPSDLSIYHGAQGDAPFSRRTGFDVGPGGGPAPQAQPAPAQTEAPPATGGVVTQSTPTVPLPNYVPGSGVKDKSRLQAEGRTAGQFTQEQKQALPQAEVQVRATSTLIDSIINDPAIEYSMGEGVHRLRQFMHPQASADFYNKLKQLSGQALLAQLPALSALKPVSNVDAEAAVKAAIAIDQHVSPEATIESLKIFKRLMDDRMGAMRAQALQPGDVEDGHIYKGGNKADPNNWELAQ